MMKKRLWKGLCLSVSMLCICSCTSKEAMQIKNLSQTANDSTLLYRSDTVRTLRMDGQALGRPLSSQVADSLYIALQGNSLLFFQLNKGTFLYAKEITDCGNLNNYSGFLYRGDTTFVYNYGRKTVYMLDADMKVQKEWNVKESCKAKYPIDPETLTHSPMLYADGKLMLTGTGLGQPDDATAENRPISCVIDVATDRITFGGDYPHIYKEGDFGGVYFNSLYHTLGADGKYVYSFPASHQVYRYSPDLAHADSLPMGSRYTSAISASSYNALELFKDKDLRIKYYVSQHSYANIVYDKYRKVYYRIAQHPLEGWEEGTFSKPFSIIVMDAEGQLLTETPPVQDYERLYRSNMHVTPEGLLIQRTGNADEHVMEFVTYKLKIR